MTRRGFLLLPTASATASTPGSTQEFERRVVKFGTLWDTFLRRLCGCDEKKEVVSREDCSEQRKNLDSKLFEQCKSAACELFYLQERKHE